MKKTTVVIILIFAFIIGISIPFLYHNYRPLLDKYVEGNGNQQNQVTEVNNIKQEKPEESNEKAQNKIDSNSFLTKAQNLFYEGNYKSSMNTYLELYNLGYDGIDLYKNIMIVSDYLKNRPKELDNILKNAYERYSQNIEYNYYYAKYLYENSNSDQAFDVYNQILVLLDNDQKSISSRKKSLVYYYLGQLYYEKNDNESALEFFNKGININKEIVLNYLSAAQIYHQNGNYTKAIEMYQKTLIQDHSLSYLYYELALLYDKNKEQLRAHHYWERS